MSDGTQLGDWILGPVLGAGDTSSVHLSTHVDDPSRRAAIKVLSKHHREALARFRREAEILESVDHPNIVKVHSLDLEDSLPYLAMEYVPGISVREQIETEGAPPIAEALSWAGQVLDALVYLHSRNVHHRDVCTSNLVVHEGRLVIVDFGLAKPSYGQHVTVAGTRFGDVGHAPPEWIGDAPVEGDVWDRYSFGIVLYELVTGLKPFSPDPDDPPNIQAARILSKKREVEFVDPGEGFPDDLRALIRDLTARDPRDRPRSIAEVRKRFKALEMPAVEPSRPEPPREKLSEGYRQASVVGYVVVGVLGVGALVLLLAVGWRLLTAG